MTVRLTEEQVLGIHTNYRGNGGGCRLHTLCRRYGLTINEVYSVLRIELRTALKRAARGHKFVSWDPQQREIRGTEEEISMKNKVHMFGG